MKVSQFVLVGACLALSPAALAQTPPPTPPPVQTPTPTPTPTPDPKRDPSFKETVVVSASKTEQQLVNAPATITVIGPRLLEAAASSNYADLLRGVPGVNVTQISARDINITSRASTGSLATSQLAVLDGRTLYQDFFGFTMWDFMPVNFDDIKRIEVIRGPASAVWGANALNGVVNVITKSPREMPGTTLTIGGGTFPRDVSAPVSAGSIFYVNGSHAQVLNDRWAYKVSAAGFQQDALPRPTGVIPGSPTNQVYPPFANDGTTQPKLDVRVDYDTPGGGRTMSFSGGTARTSGIMHSGIGPFAIDSGATMSYGKFNYTRGGMHLQAFVNTLDGDAANLLSIGPTGTPILFSFKTSTLDFEVGNTTIAGRRHALTYGGNFRVNNFDLTIAPGEDRRTEGGGYVQDEIFLTDHFRVVAGARVDKFSSIDSAVFSPRVALLMKPNDAHTFRISYNRAFRAPSMINNNLAVTIATPLPLAVLSPVFGSAVFLVPTEAVGNAGLKEEHVDAVELSYSGLIRDRTTFSLAVYQNTVNDEILFTETAEWPLTTPPPGWPASPLAWAAVQSSAHFPQSFTYLNLGREKNRGVEIGVDTSLANGASVYANYSFQARPVTNFAIGETNLPAKHRVNVGVAYSDARWLASLSASRSSEAFWQDVLDDRFHGSTAAFSMVNATAGVKVQGGRYMATLKITNLTNEKVQQHVFGDIITRQIVAELKMRLRR